jgi:hypothetical protein
MSSENQKPLAGENQGADKEATNTGSVSTVTNAEQANAAHRRAEGYAKAAISEWFAIGRWLNRSKKEAGHGNFASIISQLEFSQEQASRYMRLATNETKLVTVTNLESLNQRELLKLCAEPDRKRRIPKLTLHPAIEVQAEAVSTTTEHVPAVVTVIADPPRDFGEYFQQQRDTAKFANRVSEIETKIFEKFAGIIGSYSAKEEKHVLQALYNLVTRSMERIKSKHAPTATPGERSEPVSQKPLSEEAKKRHRAKMAEGRAA